MLQAGYIEMSRAERIQVDILLESQGGKGTLARRDPQERGPVVVRVGARRWEVTADGAVEVTNG